MLPSVHLRRVVPLEARPPGTKVLVVLSRGVVGHWSEVPGTAVLQACVPPVVGVKAEVALHLPVQRPSELVASENAPAVKLQQKAEIEAQLRLIYVRGACSIKSYLEKNLQIQNLM